MEKGRSVILSMSENKGKKRLNSGVKVYLPVSVFCFLVFLIYDRFSHGVRSPFMTFLFLPPMVLGLLPSVLLWIFPSIPRQNTISANAYHAGVAAVTVSFLLRGIFEIAGTSSVYQSALMIAGIILLIVGIVAFLGKK